ncbi:Palmitoyl protein thioesterase containing protein [Coccidioides posadasii C735 delta SOWgp]|uniref:Palmitoyl-protein thioesterase 1 n=2 Tax=Coccidioides posadasii TaxID=199306 RepID=A0A0J6I506_COCPO|nr:Palmitoyl protein thioesterase containing protein [Coccidioides posadasii C735 delta SOWgp]EER24662.1 Palmitoyl protein thioesterase containing protein [Coccidioides posadasii C735 delta SOWgp]KMM66472.1 palmitoyl-protein thioesterase 1 [Coccidioides posadasii RMSCC 3488]|eukprot:XP_003066807.1 Palmitoyl protein thioesterase containing protein [Coccidioides posadasii C735 delta SOWgp]
MKFRTLQNAYFLSHLLSPIVSFPVFPSSTSETTQLPLVIWHGLGDDFAREGLKHIAQLAEDTNPGTYIHIIHVGDTPEADRQASFLGNVTVQLETVCKQLESDPILSTAPAVNALGFSQGGQFLRGYVERCNSPPVRNLVTFGSQHNGIAKFQSCAATGDWVCRGAEALLRFGAWSNMVQSRFVPAQYFRDPEELDQYLLHSNFLADINNEREIKNEQYKRNLISLNKFAMYMFKDDKLVVPKQSAHFAEVNSTTGYVKPLQERAIYTEDWLGLKVMDEAGSLEFLTVPGEHMQLSDRVLKEAFEKYFGPVEVDLASHPELVLQVQ